MYPATFRLSLVVELSLVSSVLGGLHTVRYGFSDNGEYCVRARMVSSAHSTARIQLFKYDATARRFTGVCGTHLPYWNLPLHLLISSDGRYVVALGKDRVVGDDLQDEIWIWDTACNRTQSIDLRSIFSEEELKRHAVQIPMVTGIHWFADEWADGLPPVFDDRRGVLYVTAGINDRALASGYMERAVKRYTTKRPTIVIDLRAMRAHLVDTRRVSLWKERYDREVLKDRLLEQLLRGPLLSRASLRYLRVQRLVVQSLRSPSVEMQAVVELSLETQTINEPFLFRLKPGDGHTPASILVLKYSADDNAIVLVREFETDNPIAPCDWRASRDGKYIVTLDDIGRIGTTPNTLVIYRVRDGKKKKFALQDFLEDKVIEKLRLSEHFVEWRDGIWNMEDVGAEDRTIAINRYALSHLPKVFVSLDKMQITVQHVGERGTPARE